MENLHSHIWLEESEQDNAFATRAAYCHGYDVYGEMLGKSRWVEMLYLLFRGEAPSRSQADALEVLAVALANAGPRDPANHAAMCSGVGGSPAAASLIAALAVGAGQYTGAREVRIVMQSWLERGTELHAWQKWLTQPATTNQGVWPICDHTPGFDPHGVGTPTIVKQTLDCLRLQLDGTHLNWLSTHMPRLESWAGGPIAMTAIAAAAYTDLGFTPQQGEMLYLLLRLPGAAAHALEQSEVGFKNFPFFSLELENDPAKERA